MKYGSLCSGIEAASEAWVPLGWRAAFFSEIDAFPCAVLKARHPGVPNFGDMTRFKEWGDTTIDVLVGGTPCQSFSVAGLRKGLADPRGNLMLTYLAIADRYRPDWLVWENVPGVLSDRGNAFGAFLGGLAELGYGFAYRVLDAQYCGVPQRRRRVFVVGCLGDWRRAAAVLFERASLRGDPAPRRKAGERPAPTISARTQGCGGLGTDFDCDGGLIAKPLLAGGHANNPIDENLLCLSSGQANAELAENVSTTLTTLHEAPIVAQAFKASHFTRGKDGAPSEVVPPLSADADNPQPGDPCHPLAAEAHAPAIAFDCKASGQSGFGVGEVASTQRAMGHVGSHQNAGGHQAVMTDMQVRRLTPRECERLQGFPDDYTLITVRGKPAADGPRYKALGNSMAVPVMRWIGERIALVDAIAHDRKEAAA